jgi:hypothetical protein
MGLSRTIPETILRLTLLAIIVRGLAPGLGRRYRTGEVNLAKPDMR